MTILQIKIDSNPENTVGLMTMAHKGCSSGHTSRTSVKSSKGSIPPRPKSASRRQSTLLKHRENKNLRQCIVVFVGSPLQGVGADKREMVKLAKKHKKNNVATDFVSFGDGIEEGESNVLRSFTDNATSGDNSRVVTGHQPAGQASKHLTCGTRIQAFGLSPGPHLLSDFVLSSLILVYRRGAMADAASLSGSGGANNLEFGVDPSVAELAMALRMSMEEDEARQAAEEQARQVTENAITPAEHANVAVDVDDGEAMLRQAIAMSEGRDVDMEDGQGDDDELDEEEAIARVIEMSMKQDQGEKKKQ